ncbi:hypothetical protein BH09PSE5_BH09PSE5_35410 [soil metagenome]
MNALPTRFQAADTTTNLYRDPPAPVVRLYVPIAAAVVVALSSAVTLTAYEKPLDRKALTPSVIEFIEATYEEPSVRLPNVQLPEARAMLLRYELTPTDGIPTNWHPQAQFNKTVRGEPFLL